MMPPRLRTRALAFSFVVAALTAACASASPEQQVLINYFRAARLQDTTALDNIAVVRFDPRAEGVVETFAIRRIGPEQRRPLSGGASAKDRALAVRSLTPSGQRDLDVAESGMDVVSKQVVLNATVRLPDGSVARRTVLVTIERAVARTGTVPSSGRWIVTAVQQEPPEAARG